MSVHSDTKFRHRAISAAAAAIVSSTIISTLLIVAPTRVQAQGQGPEEIVVTAQRRVQSLQDVPISIDTVSSEVLRDSNFRNLEELTAFTPGVFLEEGGDQGSDTFVRGFGTVGRNWANDSAVPLFLDDVYLGQSSLGALSFMDVERIEILKGPQPIYFGMNATAGAINIISARPTREWEGYVVAEVGQSGAFDLYKRTGDKDIAAAIGGPLTDTLAFRAAVNYETSDGYIRDAITQFPLANRADLGGRLSLEWTPNDRLTAYGKIEAAYSTWTSGGRYCVRTVNGEEMPTRLEFRDIPTFDEDVEGEPDSLWLPWPQGSGWAGAHLALDECGEKYEYTGTTNVLETPPLHIRTRDTLNGFPDIRAAADLYIKHLADADFVQQVTFGEDNEPGFLPSGTGASDGGIYGGKTMKPVNALIDLSYVFDNGIEVSWVNGYLTSYFTDLEFGRNTPLFENLRYKEEDYEQLSTELRISSYEGGTFEWLVGAFFLDENLQFDTTDFRAVVRRGARHNNTSQDSQWSAAFANLTFNFLDDRLSIDVGGRYTSVDKRVSLDPLGAQWIFDVTPCLENHPDTWQGNTSDWGHLPVHEVTPADCVHGVHPNARRIAADQAIFLLPSVGGRDVNADNLWYLEYGESRNLPATWRSPYTYAVGMTPFSRAVRAGERWIDVEKSWSDFDPQVVLRYRPNSEISLYAKYAQGFKAGGFNLGFGGALATSEADLSFDPEYSETFEIGAGGSYWDGKGRFKLAVYRMEFDDFIATTVTNPLTADQGTEVINIGRQRSQGLELTTQLSLSDQLLVGLNFVYLNSEFLFFPNSFCTEHELRNAPESGCNPESGLIDRSGQTPAYAPEWGVAANVKYWIPFRSDYQFEFGTRVFAQGEYFTDFRGFSKAMTQPTQPDINLHVGFGDITEKWMVALAARNLLESRPEFHPERTSGISAIRGASLRSNQVKSIALQFTYNFL